MLLPSDSRHWFFRYRLYHLPFWLVYHYLWWALSAGNPLVAAENIFSVYGFKYITYVLLQALGVYFNLYWLLPRLLERGKVSAYLVGVTLTVAVVAGVIPLGYYFTAWVAGQSFEALFNHDPADYLGLVKGMSLPSTLAAMTLGMSIKMAKNWLESRQRQQALEKEKLTTELKFLKSQFNPHFLFNTINSIFVLIHKSPDMASEALAKFSDLLRYQLYECNDPFIALDRELAFLENFLELERLRQNSDQSVTVELPDAPYGDFVVAPFLLLPFLENAFKHMGPNRAGVTELAVNLWLAGNTLRFEVWNSTAAQLAEKEDLVASGIGLKNVGRRLALLYPGRHDLHIRQTPDSYAVSLRIELSKAPVSAAVSETIPSYTTQS